MPDEDVNWFDGFYLVNDNRCPLQLPDRDRVIRRRDFGGPATQLDVRCLLSVEELTRLLDVAKSSASQRVMLPCFGLSSTTFETPAGHRYEVVQLVSSRPRPETSVLDNIFGGSTK